MSKMLRGLLLAIALFGGINLAIPSGLITQSGPKLFVAPTGGDAPAWFDSLADKTWSTVASAGIEPVLPAVYPGGQSQPDYMLRAWSGGEVDSTRYELQLPAGGGHNDYYGNEVYVLPLNTEVPAWQRVTSPRTSFGSGDEMDNGTPRASHNGGQITYVPTLDRTIVTGLSFYSPSGAWSGNFWAFARATNTWTNLGGVNPDTWGEGSGIQSGSDFDPTTGIVWAVAPQSDNSVARYNTGTGVFSLVNVSLHSGYNSTAALSPSKRCLVVMNGNDVSAGTINILNLDNPTAGWTQRSVSGFPAGNGNLWGIVWHEASGAFLVWGWGSDSRIAKLIPPANPFTGTWTVSLVSAAGGVTPSAPITNSGNVTAGRFNIVPDFAGSGRDLVVLFNAYNGPTYVYKIPAAGL